MRKTKKAERPVTNIVAGRLRPVQNEFESEEQELLRAPGTSWEKKKTEFRNGPKMNIPSKTTHMWSKPFHLL